MRSQSRAVRLGRRARAGAVAAAIGLSLVAGACGGDSDSPTNAAAAAAAAPDGGGKSLTIKNFAFSPQPFEVPKGTVVRVTNEDDAAHTATADGGAFDTGSLAQGESKEITLSEPGDIAFHCNIHDYMKGVIRVTP